MNYNRSLQGQMSTCITNTYLLQHLGQMVRLNLRRTTNMVISHQVPLHGRLMKKSSLVLLFLHLKLRLSAGITGNQDGLAYGQFVKRQRFAAPSINDDGSINRPGLETVAVQNPDLKWEETTDYNIGY